MFLEYLIKPPLGTGRRIVVGVVGEVFDDDDVFGASAVPHATHIINSRSSVSEIFIPAIAVADGYLVVVYLINSWIASS